MVAETLVPAPAEKAVIDELDARLPDAGFDGVSVATTIPSTRPAEFIRLFVTGGTGEDIAADAVTLVVEAYASKKARAERLCAFAVAVLQTAGRDGELGGVPCRRVDVFSLPANLPDPNVSDRYRYTSTISAALRRVAV